MKEILYIQAGTRANYVATHFWNTQEAYLAQGSSTIGDAAAFVNHGRSFFENISDKVGS
jgi:hypothetical protein